MIVIKLPLSVGVTSKEDPSCREWNIRCLDSHSTTSHKGDQVGTAGRATQPGVCVCLCSAPRTVDRSTNIPASRAIEHEAMWVCAIRSVVAELSQCQCQSLMVSENALA
ncbi:hypothetical protein IF1G_10592 [Cordyceps javanica]|uniref:Uncharacterized protein n=1 Tax=Cordyceps javanica TaxID=43265 RepID=A0A545UN05_9HYPO|nr:hypothetical protein IF1G_10592 [Cordyceps javanica]